MRSAAPSASPAARKIGSSTSEAHCDPRLGPRLELRSHCAQYPPRGGWTHRSPACSRISPRPKRWKTARSLGLNAISLPSKGVDTDVYAAQVCEALRPLNVDLICLAGFMRRVGKPLLDKYAMRILNIHPSLLPAFRVSTSSSRRSITA